MSERGSAAGEERVPLHWPTFTGALKPLFEREQVRVWVEYWNTLSHEVKDWFANKNVLVWVEINALPMDLAPGKLYVLGAEESLRAIAMQCPCGCGGSIHLNLLPHARPSCEITHHSDGTVSLHPTIRSQSGCGSHFFVRRSRVYWWNCEAVGPRTCADTAAGLLQRSPRLSEQSPVLSSVSRSPRSAA